MYGIAVPANQKVVRRVEHLPDVITQGLAANSPGRSPHRSAARLLVPTPLRTTCRRARLAPGAGCPGQLGSEPQKTRKQFIALPSQMLQRAVGDLLQHSVDDRLLQLRGELRSTEVLPACTDGSRQMLHEMLNPTRAPPEVKKKIRSHDSPAQYEAPAHCSSTAPPLHHILLDQGGNFTIQSGLQSIGNVSHDFLANVDWLPADRGIERHRLLNDFRGGPRSGHHFHERNDMRRIEGMTDDATLRMDAPRLYQAHRNTRRTRGDDRVDGCRSIQLGEQPNLEVRSLRSALLNEVRLRYRRGRIQSEGKVLGRTLMRKPNNLEGLPRAVHIVTQPRFSCRIWIRGDDVKPACEVQRGPARTDYSRSHNRNTMHWFDHSKRSTYLVDNSSTCIESVQVRRIAQR